MASPGLQYNSIFLGLGYPNWVKYSNIVWSHLHQRGVNNPLPQLSGWKSVHLDEYDDAFVLPLEGQYTEDTKKPKHGLSGKQQDLSFTALTMTLPL